MAHRLSRSETSALSTSPLESGLELNLGCCYDLVLPLYPRSLLSGVSVEMISAYLVSLPLYLPPPLLLFSCDLSSGSLSINC